MSSQVEVQATSPTYIHEILVEVLLIQSRSCIGEKLSWLSPSKNSIDLDYTSGGDFLSINRVQNCLRLGMTTNKSGNYLANLKIGHHHFALCSINQVKAKWSCQWGAVWSLRIRQFCVGLIKKSVISASSWGGERVSTFWRSTKKSTSTSNDAWQLSLAWKFHDGCERSYLM